MHKGKKGRAKTYDSGSLMFRSVTGVILISLGLVSAISVVGGIQGAAFTLIKQTMVGLGGALCLGISLFLIWGGALVAFSAYRKAPVRAILFLMVFYVGVLGMINLLSKIGETPLMVYTQNYSRATSPLSPTPEGFWETIRAGYQVCMEKGTFGGALGMLTAMPLWAYVGQTGGVAILCVLCLICVLFFSRFDLPGTFRQLRENSEHRLEQREVEREKKRMLKALKAQQAEEAAGETVQPEPESPRRRGKDRRAVETRDVSPAAPEAAPVRPEPVAAYAGGMVGYAQPAGLSGVMGGVPVQTTLFTMQPSAAKLYDEMIVPEVPDGSASTQWQLERPGAAKASAPTPEAPAPVKTAPPERDREVNRVIGRMEDIRKRKEEILQKIDATNGNTALPYGPGIGLERAISAERQTEEPPAARAKAVGKSSAPAGEPATPARTAEQVAYARQTAAYTPPANAELRSAATGASAAAARAADRFAAYKRPANDASAEPAMSGQRLDPPMIKPPKPNPQAEQPAQPRAKAAYPYPMIELLNLKTQTQPDTRDQDRANAMRLEKTLESFGIPARVQRVTHGPAVTRFELGLVSSGINVKRIMNIADNIALDMAANGGVRIEVPIPGTNLFGVEVPNKEIISVSLAEVLTSPEMTNAKSPLSVALGKDIAGRPIICDLAKMPHLLIAGQTGSGKSVCINAIINSLLYRSSPDEVRMIMIDPKVVELQGYNQIPHLLIPVVSDPLKASGALAWAVQEMLDRYHKMQSKGVREITAYNAKVTGDEPRLPRIVIIIDELSDLMLACKRDVEESIIRLAQLARAAGIHVVVATQRPTVNVITGLIKANIPSRIAFAVASSIDSRTILDMNGAEKLLGRGDMFYYPTGEKAPLRVQGCYLSDQEISDVTDYIGKNSATDYDERITEIMESPSVDDADDAEGDEGGSGDERLQEAIEMAITDGQASISMLQRRMKIGYARAGRLIDDMAARGIVSRSAGSKPRDVLISYEQYLEQRDTLLR